ncbi:MAG: hypothetical protein HY298_01770 [Verrucomicrobia bacterium]|nr:hypothetical protein [Verrucomicrobiota bacterium]
MKHKFLWVSAMALAVTVSSQFETKAITNGVILISTRAGQDTAAGTSYYADEKGSGMVTPGDVHMLNLLCDHGYTCRLVLDQLLDNTGAAAAWCTLPPTAETWFNPIDPNSAVMLFIVSGSGGSGDAPPPTQTNGIPMMVGEHVVLGNRADRPGSIHMYENGSQSSDRTQAQTTNKYMKVLAPNHPIMQGIPLDAQGRVKIWRDKYPEETKYIPVGGRDNYTFRWPLQLVANAAAGTTILGVLDEDPTLACFAVNDAGGLLATNINLGYAETNLIRLVHMFVNEEGSNSARRDFNALTDLGRVIFVRAAKWAMGETLTPYVPLNINISALSNTSVQVQWTASADKNYKIVGSTDLTAPLFNWQTLKQDIPGVNGTIQKTLDIAAAPQTAFLRVVAEP